MTRSEWIDDLVGGRCLAEISMWSADLGALAADMRRIDQFADMYHFDVADGTFAPDLLFFPDLVRALRPLSQKPFHIHLMINDKNLLQMINSFIDTGADLISVHVENENALMPALKLLDDRGVAAGIALQLKTPIARIEPLLDRVRAVLLLGTAIGVKGQDLSSKAPGRLREASKLLLARKDNKNRLLIADGGIRETTVPSLVRAGAQTVVMGSLAFGASNLEERFVWLRDLKAK